MKNPSPLGGDAASRAALVAGDHTDPHLYLGPHSARLENQEGVVVRAFHPNATAVDLLTGDEVREMTPVDESGVFAAFVADVDEDLQYRLRFHFEDGNVWEREDAYRFSPTVGDLDLYLFAEGTHRQLWQALGCRPMEMDGVAGYAFAVWAPNARRVSVVGNFCHWNGGLFPMRRLGPSGVFELFIPGLADGEVYKYEIVGRYGVASLKADPVGRWCEKPSQTASRTYRSDYTWGDGDWLKERAQRDAKRSPMNIYEVHLGSWKQRGGEHLTYRELAEELVAHVQELGFNYIQLMPISEHPYSPSWGYQVAGYYAPTARFGAPDDLRFFIDHCHQNDIGVLLDWVPGHFVKDAHGLGRFDGSALYEHEDPRRGEHPDWGTYIFNHGRFEVLSFLVSNAVYWIEEFHFDGLRIDAVASMLYLDYSREDGEWLPNQYGGKENLEAINMLQKVNQAVHEIPGAVTVAEESTSWPNVSGPIEEGGLGFDFKWNMGWMHDTLKYFSIEPFFRSHHQDTLTFAMVYEYSERFVNPLSHDEVVHGKRSLLDKMPGDAWRKFANLRTLLTYQLLRPGKSLLFMGSELAPWAEWNSEVGLDWSLQENPSRAGLLEMMKELGKIYHAHPCLWESDHDPEGFRWISCQDRSRSVIAFERRESTDPASHLVLVLNLTPVPRSDYRLGAPRAGAYRPLMSTDDARFGGSGYAVPELVSTSPEPWDGYDHSMSLVLPPLAMLVLAPEDASC